MPKIINKITNMNADEGAIDDVEVIGGYKVVQTPTDLEVLKTTELTDEKHILTNGCAVYVASEQKLYRWDAKEKVFISGDESGLALVATTGSFYDLKNIPTMSVDDDGVLDTTGVIGIEGVTQGELDSTVEQLREEIAAGGGGTVNLNIEDGKGTGAVQQVADGVANGFSFTGKNENATGFDVTLTGTIPYGATGNYSSAFGGKSAAQGKRSHAEGTTTIAKGNYSHAEGDNSVALGADIHAEGYSTTSKGTGSHAEGSETVAGGNYSHAEGIRTITTKDGAHAEGCDTSAAGEHSHAEGNATRANGTYSHAEGHDTNANGTSSHAEGSGTIANGVAAHAEGCNTHATGDHSHAEGYNTVAFNDHAHAEGNNTTASGAASHAEGTGCFAEGDHSHAGGVGSTAKAWGSFAHGQGVIAQGTAQAVVGKFNSNDGDAVFEVGNGTADDARSTAFRVLADGRAKVKGSPTESDDVVTKSYVDSKETPAPDLSGYATKEDLLTASLGGISLYSHLIRVGLELTDTTVGMPYVEMEVILPCKNILAAGTHPTDSALDWYDWLYAHIHSGGEVVWGNGSVFNTMVAGVQSAPRIVRGIRLKNNITSFTARVLYTQFNGNDAFPHTGDALAYDEYEATGTVKIEVIRTIGLTDGYFYSKSGGKLF